MATKCLAPVQGLPDVSTNSWPGPCLVLAVLLPTAIAWCCCVWLNGNPSVRWVYLAGKTVQLLLPVFWVKCVEKGSLGWPRPPRDRFLSSLSLGGFLVAAMMTLYYGWLRHTPTVAAIGPLIDVKLRGYGLNSPLGFLAAAAYCSLPHTLAEEYYWRWFVLGRLRLLISPFRAVVASGLLFAIHHVILIHHYWPESPALVAFFSAWVALASMGWAWIYVRSGSVLPGWISHAIVNAGIAWISYDLWIQAR